MGVIYRITHSASGRCYIGQTVRDVQLRWREHCNQTKGCIYLKNALNKYGVAAFTFEVLVDKECTKEELNDLEVHYIKELDTRAPQGFNLRGGGDVQWIHNWTRQKMSLKKLGKKATDATRIKMSASRKGALNPRYGKPSWHRKAVSQYTWDGHFVESHDTLAAAAKYLNVSSGCSISAAAKGLQAFAHGFQWRWKVTSPTPTSIPPLQDKPVYSSSSQVYQYTHTGQLLNTHDSIQSAAACVGVKPKQITQATNGKSRTVAGFQWRMKLVECLPAVKLRQRAVQLLNDGCVLDFESIKAAAAHIGAASANVSMVLSGVNQRVKGYGCRYKVD